MGSLLADVFAATPSYCENVRELPTIQIPPAEPTASRALSDMCIELKRLKRKKAVPEWAAPAEIWQFLCGINGEASAPALPPDSSRAKVIGSLLARCIKKKVCPQGLADSQVFTVSNGGSTRGPTNERPINLTDPLT